jgi:hypothetical protein
VDVTLVLESTPRPEVHRLGLIPAGETRQVAAESTRRWFTDSADSLPVNVGFRVHWSSTKGHASEERFPPIQLF